MENPRGFATIGAIEIDLEDPSILDLHAKVGPMAAASPILFGSGAREPPVMPKMFYRCDPVFHPLPREGNRLCRDTFTADVYFLADESCHRIRLQPIQYREDRCKNLH